MAPVLLDAGDARRRIDAGELVAGAGLPTVGLDQAWAIFVITDQDGSAIGVSALERHGTGRPTYLLRSLVVRSDRQGSGLGAELVEAALAEADSDSGGQATVGLLTESAVGYFERFGFRHVTRDELPEPLSRSPELAGACSDTAPAYLRGDDPRA